jgi:aspartyl aminopeptidase
MHKPTHALLALATGAFLSLGACGERLAPRHSTGTHAKAPSAASSSSKSQSASPANLDADSPSSKTGWGAIGKNEKPKIDAFSKDYLEFLAIAGTQRATAKALLAQVKNAGGIPFDGSGKHKAGSLLFWQDAAGSSLALLKIGEHPLREGLRVIIATTDGGVIRLTPSPGYEKSGLALFDTSFLGKLKMESWLNTPLLLDIHVAGPRDGQGKTITIGDDADEPVFTIPDLLPHLSRKVQRKGLIDSPERLDALAAFSLQALTKGLKSYGLSPDDWNRAEAQLLPAQGASYIGVDRALIAGPNHQARAFPFAATRALLETPSRHTTLVILTGHSERSYAGADSEAHIQNLLPMAIGQQRSSPDALELRQIYARTKVLLFDNVSGERNHGVVLNSRKDDSSPLAFRDAMQSLESTKTQYQIVESSGWSDAREIASLDMDAVEVGLPITGVGTPSALLSTLDLYQALLACQGWISR